MTFWRAIKTPYPSLLSFLYTVYPAGKISEVEMDEESHDSQPAITFGEWSEIKLIKKTFFVEILWQLITAMLKPGLVLEIALWTGKGVEFTL